ncbi:phospholipid/cholesterol/gamma-HCH transport system substrate-binding protein [Gammaproteobacteria bacterium]
MQNRVGYAAVGLFVVLLGLAAVAVALWLAVGTSNKVYDTYLAYMSESVSGLNPEAPVKYRGVDIGRVVGISLVPNNPEEVELRLSLERGAPIRRDTVAVLKTQGLTGIAYVELTGGSRNAEPLISKKGHPAVILTAPSLLERLDIAVTTVLGKIEALSGNFAEILAPENRAALAKILANLDTITSAVAQRTGSIDQTLANASISVDNIAMASNSLVPLLDSLHRGANTIELAAHNLARAGDGASSAVQDGRRSLTRFSQETLPEVTALATELRDLVAALKRFTEQLQRDPNSLVFGRRDRRLGPGE